MVHCDLVLCPMSQPLSTAGTDVVSSLTLT
jgi:hypothetical protein